MKDLSLLPPSLPAGQSSFIIPVLFYPLYITPASRLARFRILCCFLPALFRLPSRRRPSVCTAASQKKGDVSYCFVPLFRCPPLAQHCMDITVMSTCYFRQHCVVVGQRCHRIASLLRLALTEISSTHDCNIHAMLCWRRCLTTEGRSFSRVGSGIEGQNS